MGLPVPRERHHLSGPGPRAKSVAERVRAGALFLVVVLIRFYQFSIRPLLLGSCKFCPTCSEYAIDALHVHGLRGGVILAAGRVLRCHPFSPGGIDPVPDPVSSDGADPPV